jgi:hypothetical protein
MLLQTNAKLLKSTEKTRQYLMAGLTLAPHSLSGRDVCKGSSAGCRESCNMWFSGRRVMPQSRYSAIAKTIWYFDDREAFIQQLHRDIARHVRRAEQAQLSPVIRLNMASDLDWISVIERWHGVAFIDYTKIRSRFERYLKGSLPENYHLTFSRHERHSVRLVSSFLKRGGNVAQVFDVPYHGATGMMGPLPELHQIGNLSAPVIDGDLHDVRLPQVDGCGVIVGLRVKGTNAAKSIARKSGFAT